jgi:hypothetical protein
MGHDSEHREREPEKRPRPAEDERQSEIAYRNVDEEAEHDESGPQGPGPEENPPRER